MAIEHLEWIDPLLNLKARKRTNWTWLLQTRGKSTSQLPAFIQMTLQKHLCINHRWGGDVMTVVRQNHLAPQRLYMLLLAGK